MWTWFGSWESVRSTEWRLCIARHTYESGWLGNEDPKTELGAAEKQYVSVRAKDVPRVRFLDAVSAAVEKASISSVGFAQVQVVNGGEVRKELETCEAYHSDERRGHCQGSPCGLA